MKLMSSKVLEIRDLSIAFQTDESYVHAINSISFDVLEGEICALVGESGSGKSVTAQAIMGLVGRKQNEIVKGSIKFSENGKSIDILRLRDEEIRDIRGRKISMVFQEPMTSLHPEVSKYQ